LWDGLQEECEKKMARMLERVDCLIFGLDYLVYGLDCLIWAGIWP